MRAAALSRGIVSQMNAAEQAYRAARAEIARVAEAGETELWLTGKAFAALDTLPPELASLTVLQTLGLKGTQVSDLTPLADLTALQSIWLDHTLVSDLTPLATLTGLKRLYAFGTQVRDLAPLAALTAMESLYLHRTQVRDLAPLAALTALQNLRLSLTAVSDLGPLAAMAEMQTLWLERTQVSDLAPLAALTALQTLWLSDTQVKDLAPLTALTTLKDLYLDGTLVSDLAPLAQLTALRTLWLSGTQVSSIAPLTTLTTLHQLLLDRTQVSDLGPLAALRGLDSLDLDGSLVGDLRPLTGLEMLGAALNERTGVSYSATPAIQRDARLAALSQVKIDEQRTRETLAYLRSLPPWPEPYTPEAPPGSDPPPPDTDPPPPPEQDPALLLIGGEAGFAFLARSIDSDPVTDAALGDLRALLADLRRKGNRHDDLYCLAGEMQERSDGPVRDLRLVTLHLSYQKLRRMHAARATRDDPFDAETVATMEAVFDVVPGVTLADPDVRVLIERQEAERAQRLSEAQAVAAESVLTAVQHDGAPFAPEVKDVARESLRPGVDDRLTATRGILSRNVVVSVLRWVGSTAVGGAIGGPVGNFVYEYGNDLLAYAATMGGDALFWAQSVLARFRVEYELAMGIGREMSGALPHGPKPFPHKGERPKL
jgi:Leucine-rich repeat (LRR) protein